MGTLIDKVFLRNSGEFVCIKMCLVVVDVCLSGFCVHVQISHCFFRDVVLMRHHSAFLSAFH